MTKKLHDDFDLDALFADERTTEIAPSYALMKAILDDAQDVQPSQQQPKYIAKPTPWWQGIVQQLGGWQAVGTYATFACFGLYIGYVSSFDQVLGLATSTDTAVLSDVFDSFSVASEFEISFLEG